MSGGQRKTVDRGYAPMGGTRLYYEVAGDGPPAVLIHAGFVDRRIWDPQWERLPERHRVVRYDLRGAGKSAGSNAAYFDHEDLQKLLERLEIERAHVVGLATGGLIALDLAVARPDLVATLTLVSTAHPQVRPSEVSETRRREAILWYGRGKTGKAVEAILRAWVDGPERAPGQVDPAIRDHVRRLVREDLPRQRYQASRRPMNPPSFSRLDEVRAPALVIAGDLDAQEIRTSADLYAGGIRNASKVLVPGSGHMVNLERTRDFGELLEEFWSSSRGNGRAVAS